MKKGLTALLAALLATLMLLQLGPAATHAEESQLPQTDGTVQEVWVPTNTQKVLRDQPFPVDNVQQSIAMEAAKNEYESGQVIIKAVGSDLTGVYAGVTDLTLQQGTATIPASTIQLFREHYIEVKTQTSGVYPKGWYPDALIPLQPASRFDIMTGNNQGIWITVKVPKGQQPGVYEGQLTIQSNEKTFDVPVSLRVWDFELADDGHTQTAFAIWADQVAYAHGVQQNTPEYWQLLENYYWFQTEYRLPPVDLPIPSDDVDQYIAQAERFLTNPKVNSFRIPYYDGNPQKTKELVDKLREKGWLDKGYFFVAHLIDEPGPDRYPLVRQISEELAQIAPDVKHLVTKEPIPELTGYVNTWVPQLHMYDRGIAQQRQTAGDHVWWYTMVAPRHPFPTYHIDDDLLGARLLSWMQKENKVEGNLYWSTTIFRKFEGQYIDRDVWNDPMAFPGANGDGYLMYPGKDLGIDGPVPTLRLEAIREGMEDYEYLWMFEQRMKEAAQQLGLPGFDVDVAMKVYYDRLYKATNSYDEEPDLLLQVRREIAEHIVSLKTNPLTLFNVTVLGDLKQQVTIYAENGATVQLNGETLQPTEQQATYDVYAQTVDLQSGMNLFTLTVTKGGIVNQQTIVLVGKQPAPLEYVIPLNDAETNNDIDRWTRSNVNLSLSTVHTTQGQFSMKADYQPNVGFPNIRLLHAGQGFRSADWSKYKALEFDVYNPQDTTALFYVKFFDENGQAYDMNPVRVSAGMSETVRIPSDAMGGVDRTKMAGIELWMWEQTSSVTLYFDNFHFVAGEPLPSQNMSHHLVYNAAANDLTIDGELNEDAWSLALEYPYTSFGNTENKGKFNFLWNDRYLYAAFDITDQDVRNPTHDTATWEDDSVELFIDGDFVRGPRNEHAPQYTIRFNDNQVFLNGAASDKTRNIKQKTKKTDAGYTLEMAIPWEAIGIQPQEGKTIGITSHVNDVDVVNGVTSYGVLGYTPNGMDDVTTTANWGEFVLSPEKTPESQGAIAINNCKMTDLAETKELTSLKHNEDIMVSATIENSFLKNKTVAFVAALYDKHNKLIRIAVVEKTVEAGKTETFKAGFDLPNNANGNRVKVCVWDSLKTKKPYTPDIVFPE